MKNFNILIVEDEALVAVGLKQQIEAMGFHVLDYATQPSTAREIVEEQRVDLILMDIHLGQEVDGIELYRSLETTIPVLYLTAYQDEATISRAIETNPCGYLVKPYKVAELKAMIELIFFKAQQRKSPLPTASPSESLHRINHDYTFDLENDRLYYHTVMVHLTTKETQLLRLLIAHHGQPLSFNDIQHTVWEDEPISHNAIRTLIYRLRGKLDSELIQKVFGYGIKLSPPPGHNIYLKTF